MPWHQLLFEQDNDSADDENINAFINMNRNTNIVHSCAGQRHRQSNNTAGRGGGCGQTNNTIDQTTTSRGRVSRGRTNQERRGSANEEGTTTTTTTTATRMSTRSKQGGCFIGSSTRQRR